LSAVLTVSFLGDQYHFAENILCELLNTNCI
jgi:hypothetical protein